MAKCNKQNTCKLSCKDYWYCKGGVKNFYDIRDKTIKEMEKANELRHKFQSTNRK